MAETIQAKKIVKKKFFEVPVPLTAARVKLYATNQEELTNKIITLDMTKSLKGKNLELKAKVSNKEGKLDSEIISLVLIPSYIRRTMRRGIDYVEDSFKTSCKDSELLIKPFMITRNHVSRQVRKEIRNAARKFIESHARIKNSRELFSEIMTNKLQKAVSLKVKKVYPLAFCEIRWIEIVGPAKKTKELEVQTEESQ
jgi:ribosomal protein S3AE